MLERIIELTPAYDKRPKYGQHCVDLRMVIKGLEGAVQFVLFTGWYPSLICKEGNWQDFMQLCEDGLHEPMPADLGYHSRVPKHEGQTPIGDCAYLDGAPCFYDGSGCNAYRIFSVLVHEGSDGVWRELEKYYESTFKKEGAS